MAKHAWRLSCMGDSLTNNFNYRLTVLPFQLWPSRLQAKLRAEGHRVAVRNFAKTGITTEQMVSRFPRLLQSGVPEIGIIFGGANDPHRGIKGDITQANIEHMVRDLQDAGCRRIIVVSGHLLNYTIDSDIPDVIDGVPKSDGNCYYASVIAAQKAAAESTGAVYCDLYNYFRERILQGHDAPNSATWHVAGRDQHFNAYGHGLVAAKMYETIQSQGWNQGV